MIIYRGTEYETRDIDMTPTWGKDGYTITVAQEELERALMRRTEGGGYEARSLECQDIDEQIAGYIPPEQWELPDEELAKWIDENLYQ